MNMKNVLMNGRFWGAAACATCCLTANAEASLQDEVDLMAALKQQPPCCVIDARSEASRKKSPLADALVYRPGLSIVPSASVIVVGDTSPAALQVAHTLAKQHPDKPFYAVRGGLSAWEFVRKALDKVSASSGAAPAGVNFVIPHNTCETGTPLQILSSSPKTQSKP
jgi:hypothetical protein